MTVIKNLCSQKLQSQKALSIHLHIKTKQMMKQKQLLETGIVVFLVMFIHFLFAHSEVYAQQKADCFRYFCKRCFTSSYTSIQHINLKWFNSQNEWDNVRRRKCAVTSFAPFTSNACLHSCREPRHFSCAVSASLLEERFVCRTKSWATPWGSA